MTTIETDHVLIARTAPEIFEYLSDCRNYEALLPQDRISHWEASAQQFSFRVQGTATIDLSIDEMNFPSKLVLQSGEKSPFDFTLQGFVEDRDDVCNCYLIFEGDINPMLRAMISKPLTNLFNYMIKRLNEVMTES